MADRNGHFQARVTYGEPGLPMAWRFRLTPAVQSIAVTPMDCTAGRMEGDYHDHHVVPTDYSWHSTVRGHVHNGDYVLWGRCTFGVNVGGKLGKADLGFRFNYGIRSTRSTCLRAGLAEGLAASRPCDVRPAVTTVLRLSGPAATAFGTI